MTMFGLMTTTAHEAALDRMDRQYRAELARLTTEAEGWRFLAQKLAGDLTAIQRATLGVDAEAGSGDATIHDADADFTPQGRRARERAALAEAVADAEHVS